MPADDLALLLNTLRFYLRGEGQNPHEPQRRIAERPEKATRTVLKRLDAPRQKLFDRTLVVEASKPAISSRVGKIPLAALVGVVFIVAFAVEKTQTSVGKAEDKEERVHDPIGEDLEFAPQHTKDVECYAMVGGGVLLDWIAKLEGSLVGVRIKHSEPDA